MSSEKWINVAIREQRYRRSWWERVFGPSRKTKAREADEIWNAMQRYLERSARWQ